MVKTKCISCGKQGAVLDRVYGYLDCEECRERDQISPDTATHEFTSSSVKNGRLEYMRSHLQPFVNGALSREYVEAFGTKGISVTKKDVKEARYVYKDLPRWHKRNDSKL